MEAILDMEEEEEEAVVAIALEQEIIDLNEERSMMHHAVEEEVTGEVLGLEITEGVEGMEVEAAIMEDLLDGGKTISSDFESRGIKALSKEEVKKLFLRTSQFF